MKREGKGEQDHEQKDSVVKKGYCLKGIDFTSR